MADLLSRADSPLEKIRSGAGGSLFFYLALALFFITIALYGGFALLNRSQSATRQGLLEEIAEKQRNLQPGLLNQIFILDSRLKNIRSILSGHTFPSNVLTFLEANTHPQVQFHNFLLTVDTRKLDMNGRAASYAALAQQIGIFERDQMVEKVEFGGLSIIENNFVGFKITLVLKPALLQTKP